jgi:hypothetical protein
MMRKSSEHHAGHCHHGKAEDDIACVPRLVRHVRHVRLVRMSGAVVTHDADADQHERREHDHHTSEDQ